MTYQLRKWIKKDLPVIRDIALSSGLDEYSNIFDSYDIETIYKQYYNNQILNKLFRNRIGFVATNNNILLGYILAKQKSDKGLLIIKSFYVRNNTSITGLGEQLLEVIIQKAKTLGYDKIWLEVIEENKKTNIWFKKKGFIFDGECYLFNKYFDLEKILAFKTINNIVKIS